MVNNSDLKIGEYYFLLTDYPVDIEIPKIKTYIYIGKNIHKSDQSLEDEYYFQDPQDYFSGSSSLANGLIVGEESIDIISDLTELISELQKIEKNRMKQG